MIPSGDDRLRPIRFAPDATPPAEPAARFLRDAEERVKQFVDSRDIERIPAFVVSNAWLAWNALSLIRDEELAPGSRFCEWGSGFGVVSGLAALAGFQACGIEIEPDLITHSRDLLADHGIDAEIHQGSYVPAVAGHHESRNHRDPGFAPADFDVVYAYPWPAEEDLVAGLFADGARPNALLVTYHGGADLRIRRREPEIRRDS